MLCNSQSGLPAHIIIMAVTSPPYFVPWLGSVAAKTAAVAERAVGALRPCHIRLQSSLCSAFPRLLFSPPATNSGAGRQYIEVNRAASPLRLLPYPYLFTLPCNIPERLLLTFLYTSSCLLPQFVSPEGEWPALLVQMRPGPLPLRLDRHHLNTSGTIHWLPTTS